MGYYHKTLSLAYSDYPTKPNYATINGIIVDYCTDLLSSAVPTTLISHTSGTSSTTEEYIIQIGNSDHYFRTSAAILDDTCCNPTCATSDATQINLHGLDSLASPGALMSIAPNYCSHQSYSVDMSIFQIYSPTVWAITLSGTNYTNVWFQGQTGNWYMAQWTGSAFNGAYRNGDNAGLTINSFVYPLQSGSYFFVSPFCLVENDEIYDLSIGVIGAYNANPSYLSNPTINQYGSNYFLWNNAFVASDVQ